MKTPGVACYLRFPRCACGGKAYGGNPLYLEKRRRLWYALYDVPSNLQKALGRKRFFKSLETDDRRVAQRRAQVLWPRWQVELGQAGTKTKASPVDADAKWWRNALREATTAAERAALRDHIADISVDMAHQAGGRAGFRNEWDEGYEDVPGVQAAERFFNVATGKLVGLTEHLDEYLGTLSISQKTKDMRRAVVQRFAKRFPYPADVARKEVQGWINELGKEENIKGKTLVRILSDLRGYWKYLRSIEVIADDAEPFMHLSIPKASTGTSKKDQRKPFTAKQVVALHEEAVKRQDDQLADLIELGMWTGARIEELCSLKLAQVAHDALTIEDAKTAAGWREVPVHRHLKRTLKRLQGDSKDGFLLSGLSFNKYGDRSKPLANALDG